MLSAPPTITRWGPTAVLGLLPDLLIGPISSCAPWLVSTSSSLPKTLRVFAVARGCESSALNNGVYLVSRKTQRFQVPPLGRIEALETHSYRSPSIVNAILF